MPSPTTKASPIARPDGVLLLQPWSTALIQRMNRRIAAIASALRHMANSFFSERLSRSGRSDKGDAHKVR